MTNYSYISELPIISLVISLKSYKFLILSMLLLILWLTDYNLSLVLSIIFNNLSKLIPYTS